MPMEIVFWLAVLIVCIVVEANTVSLHFLWFALGAIAAIITALPGSPLWLQVTVFFVTSAVLLISLRPTFKRYLKRRGARTNADRNIGETGLCVERIDNTAGQGAVRLMGKEWTARSADGAVVEEGALVRVESISGVKLIVSPLPAPAPAETEAAIL
ncbi:MAG: NfeD family protein [Oscillospiraceae bacterium]|nr:NfeD family protein [Oscillospiraceae bacterium]